MNILTLFLIMVFFHIFDDYYLQGWLASGKQKSWWSKQIPVIEKTKYKYDYLMALSMHALSWSFMVHVPIMVFIGVSGWALPISIIIHAIIHAIIDDQKANRFRINLIQDQLLHMVQIIIIIILFTLL